MKSITLFNGWIQTMIPDDFSDMPDDARVSMFPNEKRPQVIMGSSESLDGAYATFSLLDKSLSRQQLFVASHKTLSLLQRFYPACHNQRVYIIPLEDSLCGWFSYILQGKTNTQFIVAIGGKMLLGATGCAEEDLNRIDELEMVFLSIKRCTDAGGRLHA